MKYSRYNRREKKDNEDELYDNLFETRDVKFVSHYTTPEFIKNTSFSVSELELVSHIWKEGDRIYKLAEKYYNDPSLWWVICQYNEKPTESHFKIGDKIFIPLQIEKIIRYLGI